MTESQSSDQPTQLFAQLFNNKHLRGYDLIQSDQIIDQIKNDSSQFTQLLIAHKRGKQIVQELMHITLMPQSFCLNYQQTTQQNNQKGANNSQQYQKNNTEHAEEQNLNQQIKAEANIKLSTNQIYRALEILTNQYEEFVTFIFQTKEDNKNQAQSKVKKQEELDDDCIIFQLIQFQGEGEKQQKTCYKILQKMFELFDQATPIDETPCSYLVKIILPFSYQKPQQILKFICDKASKYPKLICRHLYNSSVQQLLMHVIQIQSNGNFFVQQKIQLLQIIIEQTFHYTPKEKFISEDECDQIPISFKQSNFSQFDELRIQNYLLLLRSLFQKLQDKYEQQKYLPILKDTLNDVANMNKIKGFFIYHLDFFHINNLVLLLNVYLKMDAKCFQLYKSANKPSSDNFGESLSFNKNQESSICNYDLKLSTEVLNIIEDVISKISAKQKWQSSSLRSSQYYQLLYNWLVVTQKTSIINVEFINNCLSKFRENPNNTILHNSIKAILVNYLPKVKKSFQLITSMECQLIPFIQEYLTQGISQNCFQNQLYFIGKAVLSIWEENKLLKVMKATLDQEAYMGGNQNMKEYAIRIQSINYTIEKKKIFYEKLICGDPRKIGEYQEEESSEIIMTSSSFKNFMRPALQNNELKPEVKVSRYEIGNQISNIEAQNTNIFNSAISPLLSKNNKIPSFTFEFDELPLDSDDSQQIDDQQKKPEQQNENENEHEKVDNMILLSENLDNFNMQGIKIQKILGDKNIHSDKNLLQADVYHRAETAKSVEIPDFQSKSENQDFGELRQNSGRYEEFDQNQDNFKVTTSQLECCNLGIQSANGGSSLKQQISSKLQPSNIEDTQTQTLDSQFVHHFSSYLSYNVDTLCDQVEQL